MFNLRTAVLGLSAAAIAAIGVGVAGSQAATSIQPDTTCNSSSPCTSNTNNGSGPASANTSVGGTGSTSTTDFKSTSSSNFAAGIHGVDGSSTGKFDAGVQGTSPRGMGVSGKSTSGTGVNAISTSGIAVNAVSTNGTAVVGVTHGRYIRFRI
jgi:hypothetical protein